VEEIYLYKNENFSLKFSPDHFRTPLKVPTFGLTLLIVITCESTIRFRVQIPERRAKAAQKPGNKNFMLKALAKNPSQWRISTTPPKFPHFPCHISQLEHQTSCSSTGSNNKSTNRTCQEDRINKSLLPN